MSSERGRIAITKVDIPRQDGVVIEVSETHHCVPRESTRRAEVLMFVDDNESIRVAMGRCLELNGYRVLCAADGVDALNISDNYEGPIHLLITDLAMPRMSGQELSLRLTQQRPGIKTLYMSGYVKDAVESQGLDDHGSSFLEKPVSIQTLVSRIQELLDSSVKAE